VTRRPSFVAVAAGTTAWSLSRASAGIERRTPSTVSSSLTLRPQPVPSYAARSSPDA